MSKFSNLLKLITLLKSKRRMKTKELSEALSVSERMVRKYINNLIEANINVESISGPNGGYELKGYDYLLNLDISKSELVSLQGAAEVLKSSNYDMYDSYLSAKDKISIVCEEKNNYNLDIGFSLIESRQLEIKKENDNEIKLMAAIVQKKKVKIIYNSISSGSTTRIIHPYEVIYKNDKKYLVAFCENRNEILTFKLVRINNIEILNEKFEVQSDFNLNEFLDNKIGIFYKEEIKLKLHIRKPFSYSVSETIIAKDQIITWNEDGSIIFEGTLKGKPDIIRWIINMTEAVTVIEPKELKEEIRDKLIKMLSTI